jgi:hypothetical protein
LAVVLVALAVAAALAMASAGDAHAKKKKKAKSYTRTSTVFQQRVPPQLTEESNPLTDTTPYTFEETSKIRTINNVSATLTAAVQFPDDQGLVLGLDGIDTGIPITGLSDDLENRTPLTVTGSPQNAPQIVQALKQDGQLVGTVIDRTPGDNAIAVNGKANTTLTIKGKLMEKNKKKR